MSTLAVAPAAAAAVPPLAVTAGRLAALDSYAGFDVAPPPDERRRTLALADVDGTLDAWLELLNRHHCVPAAAGSLLGEALIRAVVLAPVASMVLDQRCPDPSADNLAACLDEAGDFARSAVLRPTMAVLSTDPAATHPDSVVVSDMIGWWAERTGTTLAPLLKAVRTRAPFGLPALWGAVSDEVSSITMWVGQLAGLPPQGLWTQAERLIDALAPHAPVRMARPRPFPVTHPAGQRWFRVRGTCCLSYRSALAEGPPPQRFCSTCPLRDDESRRGHLYDYLTDLAGDGSGGRDGVFLRAEDFITEPP